MINKDKGHRVYQINTTILQMVNKPKDKSVGHRSATEPPRQRDPPPSESGYGKERLPGRASEDGVLLQYAPISSNGYTLNNNIIHDPLIKKMISIKYTMYVK